jgi:D-alanine-D-alanine ligase-like ATP-grasp enzyme
MSTENLPQSPEQPPRKPRVAVVFGGRSSEHGISVLTAGAVLRAIDRTKYDVLPIGITAQGRWALTALAAWRAAVVEPANTIWIAESAAYPELWTRDGLRGWQCPRTEVPAGIRPAALRLRSAVRYAAAFRCGCFRPVLKNIRPRLSQTILILPKK